MLPSIDYATLLQYSPKGKTELCKVSRAVTADIKNGRLDAMKGRVRMRITEHYDQLQPFLHEDITLVPVPRSSPIRESQLWPSLEIANMLASFGFGTVVTCLVRHTPVKKLALCLNANERPSVAEHYASLSVEGMIPTHQITLVDDILTQGRTGMAAASRLAERFPGASIRLFSLMRAKGLDKEIDTILNVRVETITYNSTTGKTRVKA